MRGWEKAYRAKDDLPRSIENLKKATQLAPDNSAYFNSLAGAYDHSGKTPGRDFGLQTGSPHRNRETPS